MLYVVQQRGANRIPSLISPPYHHPSELARGNPVTYTPTFPSITMEVKQASNVEKFPLLCNLALWYSDKVELNREDKRNKPSPPSMWPRPLVNQQGISQCPHHPLRKSVEQSRTRQDLSVGILQRTPETQSFSEPEFPQPSREMIG